MTQNPHMAALLGNGVTVSYNPDLVLSSIAGELVKRYDAASKAGSDNAKVLEALAARRLRTGDDPHADFEALLGPLDDFAEDITELTVFAQALRAEDTQEDKQRELVKSLAIAAKFLKNVRRFGTGHALEIIQSGTVANYHDRQDLDRFLTDIVVATRPSGSVAIGNLNYDTVVLSSLLTNHQHWLSDMADGRHVSYPEILSGEDPFKARRLREELVDFAPYADRPVRLLHLHGSLAWWEEDGGPTHALDIQTVRDRRLLEGWRQGDVRRWAPAVVLTNQSAKSRVVQRPPFALAYDAFREQLIRADRWLIVGYSFRDQCVNQIMRDVLTQRTSLPEFLVSVRGDDPSTAAVMSALGLPNDPDQLDVTVDRSGLPGLLDTPEWSDFIEVP